MLNVTVVRSKWARGYRSMLKLNGDMCCLGFVCETIGIDEQAFDGIGDIDSVLNDMGDSVLNNSVVSESEAQKYADKIPGLIYLAKDDYFDFFKPTNYHSTLIHINDNTKMSDTEREKLIIEEGLKADINFTFVD